MNIDLHMNRNPKAGAPGARSGTLVCTVVILLVAAMLTPLIPMQAHAAYTEDSFKSDDDMAGPPTRKRKHKKSQVILEPAKAKRPGGLGKEVFKEHIDGIDAFFRPMAANIVAVSGDAVISDLRSNSGVVKGMRFNIMRPAPAFVHPVTGQRVRGTETPVGMAEAEEAPSVGLVSLKVIQGNVTTGDVLRISSAPVTVYFHQGPDVDWDVSEEYYYWLTDSGRYRIIDAVPGSDGIDDLLRLAREAGAQALVSLSAEPVPDGDGVAVKQNVLWVSDGREFYSSSISIERDLLDQLKIAGKMFWPEKGKPLIVMDVPFRAELIEFADLDCDGVGELVLSTGSSLKIFSAGVFLGPPFGLDEPLTITGDMRRRHVWLEAVDADADGCSELLLNTVKDDHEAHSYLYDYSQGKVSVLWEGDVFARAVDGRVYVQGSDPDGGYEGAINVLSLQPELRQGGGEGTALSLPKGIGIHDFTFIKSPFGRRDVVALDAHGHLTLYNGSSDNMLWRSEDSYGGFLRRFKRQNRLFPSGEDQEMWGVNDRMPSRGAEVFAIYRVLASPNMPGLGYKGSGIVRFTDTGAGLAEEVYIRNIPQAVTGIATFGGKMYVLRESYEVRLLNLLKGRKLFVSKIEVYSVGGK